MATLELEARLDNLLATAQDETVNIDLFAPIIIAEREECPLCLIPFSVEKSGTVFYTCCGKNICNGCIYKSLSTDTENGVPINEFKCAFCRQKGSEKKVIKSLKKLMKNNNPDSFSQMAGNYNTGDGVFQSDTKALEMLIRAAELGNVDAYGKIGNYFKEGIVVERNISKALDYYEVAAKKGSVDAHNVLAVFHGTNNDMMKSIKHMKLAASAGDQDSMDIVMKFYRKKCLSKEDLTQTLREFQASTNLTKSKERDDARAFRSANSALFGETTNVQFS